MELPYAIVQADQLWTNGTHKGEQVRSADFTATKHSYSGACRARLVRWLSFTVAFQRIDLWCWNAQALEELATFLNALAKQLRSEEAARIAWDKANPENTNNTMEISA